MITRSVLHEKINFITLLLIVFTLPFDILACSYSITLFVANQIAEGGFLTKLKRALQNKWVLLFIGMYLIHIAGLIYTNNIDYGLVELEKKASLLVFPLVLFSLKLTPNQIAKILLTFVFACLVLTLFYVGSAATNYLQSGNSDYFILHNLETIFDIHRVYASMYFLFCIYILTFFQKKGMYNFNYSGIVYYSLITYFTIVIVLLTSRTMVIITVLSFIILTVFEMAQTKKVLKGIIMLTVFFFSFGYILFYNEQVRTILSQTYQDLDKGNSLMNYTGPNQRIEIWESSVDIIKENYLLGVGTGDTQDVLYKSYVKNNFIWGIQNGYNAHNQYLQTFISLGIFSLILFLLSLFLPAYIAFKNHHYLYLGLIFLFTISCLTESMLCAQKGIVFYAFFNSLLVFQYPEKESLKSL